MKTALLCSLNIFFILACNRPDTRIVVKVKDLNTGAGLDSARVTLYQTGQTGQRAPLLSVFTNKEGACRIVFRSKKGFSYQAEASRLFFQAQTDPTGAGYHNRSLIQPGMRDTVELFLALVSAPEVGALEKLYPRLSGADAALKLRAGDWTFQAMPRLTWADLPALLAAAADTGLLNKFPHHPTLSPPKTTRTGLAALWLVEAVRRHTASARSSDLLQAPSRSPHLRINGKADTLNTGGATLQAAQLYQNWWEMVKDLPPRQAAQKNPLAGSGLEWQ